MKVFFKQYSYNIVRELLNQFAISLFGALLSMATTLTNNVVAICVSVFAILFYLYLVYVTTWEIGSKDKVSVDVGKKPYRPFTGLWIALCANIPKLVIAIAFVFTTFVLPAGKFTETLAFILRLAFLLLGGMYTGLMMSIHLPPDGATLVSQWWMYFVVIIPSLVASGIAYYAGYKNFRLIAPLFDKKKKK